MSQVLIDKTRLSLSFAAAAAVFGAVWGVSAAAVRVQARIDRGEEKAAQHELWINQQTQRIEKVEESMGEIRVMFGKIETNTANLERQLTEIRRDGRPPR